MSNDEKKLATASQVVDDDEPDEWFVQLTIFKRGKSELMTRSRDKRIFSTGCSGRSLYKTEVRPREPTCEQTKT